MNAATFVGPGLRWLGLAFALLMPVTAAAQEAATGDGEEPGIEIDLEALDALSPDRETLEAPMQAEQPSDILAPPALDADTANQPPALTPPLPPDDAAPLPQSPAAPRMSEPGADAGGVKPSGAPIDGTFTILFDPGSADLSLRAAETLDKIAPLSKTSTARIQLFGYAGDEKGSPSTTRRLALKRAVAVRGYLMNHGVKGTRIDLRPTGPRLEEGPKEAVVIEFLEK